MAIKTLTPEAWRERLGLTYTPSSYQAAIFSEVSDGQGNAVVEAVAGSGKTTTIVSAAKLVSDGLFLAFNKVIATMLGEKLAGTGMGASTVHSHGFAAVRRAIGRVKVDANKYRDLVDHYMAEVDAAQTLAGDALQPAEIRSVLDDGFPRSAILKLLDLARLDLVDAFADDFGDSILGLADHHNVDVEAPVEQLVIDVVRLAMQWGADNPRIVDFTDMVWLPTVLSLRPTIYSWIFVDECQDISKAHRELIRHSLKRDGRALFVGDPKQAIYGFAGADADSFQAIVDEFACKQLPLSVCYRCPTSVLDLARDLCPQIEARPGAPEGVVRSSTTEDFVVDAQRGDMVLCRLNAPLMGIAFKLIAAGTSAAVRGRGDLGKGLCKVVEIASKGRRFEDFGLGLDAWEEREQDTARKRYGKRGEDALAMRLEAIGDQAECIRVIWGASGAKDSAALRTAIMSLFADDDPKVVLSSIHRAKGLEARRVFIAKPERLGVAWPNSQPWMVEQEKNLEYVAYTRAQEELVFLDGAPPEGDEEPEPGEDEPSTPEDRYLAAAAAYESGDRAEADRLLRTIPACEPIPHAPTGPAPLPPVAAGAPDTYDPNNRATRVALARRLDAALRERGFAPQGLRGRWSEVVYRRESSGLVCKVYSTIAGDEVRGVGKDSIKVALVRDGRGVGKAKRVNRTGKIEAIVARVLARVEALAGVDAENDRRLAR